MNLYDWTSVLNILFRRTLNSCWNSSWITALSLLFFFFVLDGYSRLDIRFQWEEDEKKRLSIGTKVRTLPQYNLTKFDTANSTEKYVVGKCKLTTQLIDQIFITVKNYLIRQNYENYGDDLFWSWQKLFFILAAKPWY